MTARTVTVPIELAEEIALMIPSARLLKPEAVARGLAFLEAIELAKSAQPADEPEDDGLGDRAGR